MTDKLPRISLHENTLQIPHKEQETTKPYACYCFYRLQIIDSNNYHQCQWLPLSSK